MTTPNFGSLRSTFKESFYKLVTDNQVTACKEWEAPMPEFVPVLIKLFDEKTNRILTVEENDTNDVFDFDYAIRKTGMHFEQDDLLLIYKNALENLPSIFEVYKKWFIEKITTEEMEKILIKPAR
jgi:hypothetical protein